MLIRVIHTLGLTRSTFSTTVSISVDVLDNLAANDPIFGVMPDRAMLVRHSAIGYHGSPSESAEQDEPRRIG
jgi:hypothetical protein